MKNKLNNLGILLVLGLGLIASGCGTATTEAPAGLANPASVYCEEQGYRLEMRTDADGGTYGVCIFLDGSECEEWAFYRGECEPASAVEVPVQPTEDVARTEPPAEEQPTEIPASTPTDVVVEKAQVDYEGASLSYDLALAANVAGETVPATGGEGPGAPAAPQHIRLSFQGYVLPETFHEPRILVYPVAGYEPLSELAAQRINDLRQLLAARPEAPEQIPFLPLFNAAQMTRIQASYLDFQNGSGVRFLTQYAQAAMPINNFELFYTFQGLTNDGQYYIAAILPVSHPTLPADYTAYEGGDLSTLAENYETHIAEIEAQLGGQPASSFTPDLSSLDQMVTSLAAAPTSLATAPQPAPASGTEGWQSYENEKFTYTLQYPPDATLLESPQGTGVQITGPLVDNERWPIIEITHFDSDFYHPPAGTDVAQWVSDFVLAYDEIDTGAVIAGLPAVHLTTNATEQSYGYDEYYVIKGGQLFRINIIHAGGQEDWNLYNAFLGSFSFK
jgi:putative hemolysin